MTAATYNDRCGLATVPPVQVKHEEDDAGSHLTDSRLSARRNTPTRQEEYSATTSGARNVDVKQEQEIVEAAHAFPLGGKLRKVH